MEVASQRKLGSTLNPNAPSFVPLAYRAVEDFSDEWWALIHSSPSFRDYWLQERYQDQDPNQNLLSGNHYVFIDEPLLPEDDDSLFNDIFFAENDDLLHDNSVRNEEGEEYDIMEFIAATEQKAVCVAELSRHAEKSTKSVKARRHSATQIQ